MVEDRVHGYKGTSRRGLRREGSIWRQAAVETPGDEHRTLVDLEVRETTAIERIHTSRVPLWVKYSRASGQEADTIGLQDAILPHFTESPEPQAVEPAEPERARQ